MRKLTSIDFCWNDPNYPSAFCLVISISPVRIIFIVLLPFFNNSLKSKVFLSILTWFDRKHFRLPVGEKSFFFVKNSSVIEEISRFFLADPNYPRRLYD